MVHCLVASLWGCRWKPLQAVEHPGSPAPFPEGLLIKWEGCPAVFCSRGQLTESLTDCQLSQLCVLLLRQHTCQKQLGLGSQFKGPVFSGQKAMGVCGGGWGWVGRLEETGHTVSTYSQEAERTKK